MLPIFCFIFPYFLLLHPDWLTSTAASPALVDINLLIIWSLGQRCIFTHVCCFHPWLCSKKKASVIVAHFLLNFSLFLLLHPDWLTSTSWSFTFLATSLWFLVHEHPISLVPLDRFCATFAHIWLNEHKWKTCSSNFWVCVRKPLAILFYFMVPQLRGYFS